MDYCLFSFSNFTLDFNDFHLKKVENYSKGFLNKRAEENLVVNNKDNRVFGTIGLIVATWKFYVLKTSIFAHPTESS